MAPTRFSLPISRAILSWRIARRISSRSKHFPGHGSSRADSHLRLADVSKTWREVELDPYRILAKDGMLDMVMVGHLYHPDFSDGEMLPASLSARAMEELRDPAGVGFRGVIV